MAEHSARYSQYLDRDEATTHDGRFALVPSYGAAIQVHLRGRALDALRRGAARLPAGWLPFAALGREEPQFLAVKADDDACPVAMWEHETGALKPCADSLDAFLAHLGASPAEARLGALSADLVREAVERGIGLTDTAPKAKTKPQIAEVLTTLESMLARLPMDERLRSRAQYSRGRMLRALGRFEEAVEALEPVARETACEILTLQLDRPERVLELCDAAGEDDVSPKMALCRIAALLRLGRPDDALRLARARLTDASNEKLRSARRATMTAWLTSYGKKRKLAALVDALLAAL